MRTVTVLVNKSCPHCLKILDKVCEMCGREGLTVSAIDILSHPEAAERWKVATSPALVFDESVVFAGLPDPARFHELATA